ncbi:MAG: hypothetical protein B5766_01610 [Candidatus Lumbricidophila eiseniae]|uniref:Histidine kinase domain-containing protein n=1 Tax=Candidatus Lumbricidiphila eiseniae TaxID=1969409 RepID=A0A2A6FTU1_9MICO|nr:MAG: hypothetical protein B5766_01610 [Candidatus Lumbricidophila eiseniae]
MSMSPLRLPHFGVDLASGGLVVLVLWLTVPTADNVLHFIQMGLALVALTGAVMRRRAPWVGFTLSVASTAIAWPLGLTVDPFLLAGLGLYSIARAKGNRAFSPFLLIFTLLVLGILAIAATPGLETSVRSALFSAIILTGSWAYGVHVRRGEKLTIEISALRERTRLARDVHDVLSHSLGMIGVRAGIAAHIHTMDEQALREILTEIESASREAIAELGFLLKEIRQDDPEDALSAPLDLLLRETAASAERAGIDVSMDAKDVNLLPVRVRMTVHRIVREAVTNVIRHSDATRCAVSVSADDDVVMLAVSDNGRGITLKAPEGHGLRGIRERIALLGGTIEIRNRGNEGLELHAQLPLDPRTRETLT